MLQVHVNQQAAPVEEMVEPAGDIPAGEQVPEGYFALVPGMGIARVGELVPVKARLYKLSR
jgi:hypothetical protein